MGKFVHDRGAYIDHRELNANNVVFKKVKENLDVTQVLTSLALLPDLLEESPSKEDELIGHCVICGNEKKKTFSLNTAKAMYQCFNCKSRGDMITLVKEMSDYDLKQAAAWISRITTGEKKRENPKVDVQGASVITLETAITALENDEIDGDDWMVVHRQTMQKFSDHLNEMLEK